MQTKLNFTRLLMVFMLVAAFLNCKAQERPKLVVGDILKDLPQGGTTHGSWYHYDAHIPLLWYGWKVPAGFSANNIFMTDIAPTLAALLKIQEPNGSVGKVISELLK